MPATNTFKEFGDFFRNAWREKGLTAIQVSVILGKPKGYFNNFVQRECFPRYWLKDPNLLKQLLDLLEIDVFQILSISKRNIDNRIYLHDKDKYLELHDDLMRHFSILKVTEKVSFSLF